MNTLALFFRPGSPRTDDRNVTRIGGKEMYVGVAETGEKLDNVAGMAWGPLARALCESADGSDGIFGRGHFVDDGRDYCVVVFECPAAVELRR